MSLTRRAWAWIFVTVLAAVAAVIWLGPSVALRWGGAAGPAGTAELTFPDLPPGARPVLVSDKDLVDRAADYDGQWVQFQGEALGDLMVRGDHAWLNLGGGAYAIGVILPAAEAREVKTLGDYRHTGDTVRVTGLFHRADPNQGGDLDIVAVGLEVVRPGRPRPDPRPGDRVYLAAGLSLLALALFVAAQLVQRRSAGGEGNHAHLGE